LIRSPTLIDLPGPSFLPATPEILPDRDGRRVGDATQRDRMLTAISGRRSLSATAKGDLLTDQAVLDRAALRSEVRDLLDDCAASLDDLRLDDWPEFFTDDALYQVISAENFEAGLPHATVYCQGKAMILDRVYALTKTLVYQPRRQRRFLSGVQIVDVDGDTVHVRSSFLVTQCLLDHEPEVVMVGRNVDEIVRGGDGSLLLRKRSCVYDNFRVSQSVIIPV
jgi:anthranilate 1,2-dioxygenase small subunit